jgi:hypothetical protein
MTLGLGGEQLLMELTIGLVRNCNFFTNVKRKIVGVIVGDLKGTFGSKKEMTR